jgi:hypothetical protein
VTPEGDFRSAHAAVFAAAVRRHGDPSWLGRR